MGRLRFLTYLIGCLVVACCVYSCNTSGCLENRSSIPLAGFYSYSTLSGIALDSVRVTGIGRNDSVAMTEEGTRVSQVYLPMRSTMNTTSWEFAYKWTSIADGTLCDTITFDYESYPYFASQECGAIYKYQITNMYYTHHLIDSIAITDSLITNVDVERIKIYFRTESNNQAQ